MNYADGMRELAALRKKILVVRQEIRRVQSEIEPAPVADHTFLSGAGRVTLSSLFDGKKQMIFVHNMGSSCTTAPCGQTATTGFTNILRTGWRSFSLRRKRLNNNASLPDRADGAFRW